jgi:hypothetical protein
MALHFNERGHLNEEGVALYVDALKLDRTDRLPEPIRAHVAGCQECRANVTGLYSLLAEEPVESSHPTLSGPAQPWYVRTAVYRIAAIVVAAIGIVALVQYLGNRDRPSQGMPQVSTVHQTPDTTRAPGATHPDQAESGEIAANFKPYEGLEGLIGSETRGTSFEAMSPGGFSGRHAVTFAWRTSGDGPWKLVVVNNRGSVVKEATVRSTPFVLEGPFRPGLYYWKVIQNDELAHVGKFRVE